MPVFRHSALLYSNEAEFCDGSVAFIRDGLQRGEDVLTVVSPRKISLLRDALGRDAPAVRFAAMDDVGRNPARIIQVWREFVQSRAPGSAVRGIGEPATPDRSAPALVECGAHEALLNVAFADAPVEFKLMCPYDTAALPRAVVDAALVNHPIVSTADGDHASEAHAVHAHAHFNAPLPAPRGPVQTVSFGFSALGSLRDFVGRQAAARGVAARAVEGMVLAVCEIATNALQYGGGSGEASVWSENGAFVCEIRSAGSIPDPLVGRLRPPAGQARGYGVWIANQLCDLVQIRSGEHGTTVRVHMTTR